VPPDERPVLVVGYGNPLRSDDGVGPAVAARLAVDPRLAGADVRIEHQLTPELALDASRSSLLVLVDAGVEQAPGEVLVRRLEPPAAGEGGGTAWTHHLDPAALVGLARALWDAAPPVVVVSVGPASLDVGDALTPVVEAAVGRAVDAVAAVVEAHRRGA
jgi:hydrogenase maturation protease